MPLHFHAGAVHLYTMSGGWYYTEFPDQQQTAGCYIFEPGGSIHELNTPAGNTEDTDTFMVVLGANVNFLKDGTCLYMMDASLLKAWADQGIKEQGLTQMNYISAQGPHYTR
ncbi:MAG: cupin domain-containing protein [Steroidobacteraceae bacterium]